MLRRALLRASHSQKIKNAVTTAPVTAGVVERFVAGETSREVVAVTRRLVGAGLLVSIDYLGEDTTDAAHADAVVVAYLDLLVKLRESGLSRSAEVSIKLTALGQHLRDGPQLALENAELICRAARMADTAVTLDMEDHTTTDSTLEILHTLRKEYPDTGAVLQAYLHRTEDDCRDLAVAGSRVRLCKGAYAEPETVAFQDRQQIDKSYVRCMKILMAGNGFPMLATHDPTLIDIGLKLAADHGREPGDFEFQMLYGIRPTEQQRLAKLGHSMRIYVPYGTDWYGYLVRRLAERPSNMRFFARSLITKLAQLEPVDMGSDEGVSHEGRDVQQRVGNDQRADALPAQVDQAEDHAHDQIADEAANALIKVVGAANDGTEGNDRNGVPGKLPQSSEQVTDDDDLFQEGVLDS